MKTSIKYPNRLTYRWVLEWLQAEFDRMEIKWDTVEMWRQRIPSHFFEGGAAPYLISIRPKGELSAIATATVRFEDFFTTVNRDLATGNYKLQWTPRKERYGYRVDSSSIECIKK